MAGNSIGRSVVLLLLIVIIAACESKTGVDKNEIFRMIQTIRDIRRTRDENAQSLKARTQAQYVRCLKLERQLACYIDKGIRSDILQARLDRFKIRLTRMRLRLKRMRQTASNSEVAQVLGVPKGTVDSSMFYIRKMLKRKKQGLGRIF